MNIYRHGNQNYQNKSQVVVKTSAHSVNLADTRGELNKVTTSDALLTVEKPFWVLESVLEV